MTKKEFYNPETDTTETYTEVWQVEQVKVRDETHLLVKNHYWQAADGELWVDFDHPMENVQAAFNAFRESKGYLKPDEIRALRHKLNMTVRRFAEVLGIAPSSLTQIENNLRVQAKYQENLFEAVAYFLKIQGRLPEKWLVKSDRATAESDDQVDNDYIRYHNEKMAHDRVKNFDKQDDFGDAS